MSASPSAAETYESALAAKREARRRDVPAATAAWFERAFVVRFSYVNDATNSRKERAPEALLEVCERAKEYSMAAIELKEVRPICRLAEIAARSVARGRHSAGETM